VQARTNSHRDHASRLTPLRMLAAACVLAAVTLVPGCGSDAGGAAKASPAKALRYVAFGDSWPEGAHCGGCRTFAYQWADLIKQQTARPVQMTSFMGAAERSDAESKTSTSLLSSLKGDQATQDAVRRADIVLVATGPNSLDTILPRITSGRCGGPDGYACIRELGHTWTKDFDGILDEITRLRGGRATVVRLVDAANGFVVDDDLAASAPKGFASTGGELIYRLLNQAQCSAARTHGAVCVDVRSQITGPSGDRNENSAASMRAVAKALMATGLGG
jgi:hypothetical protein